MEMTFFLRERELSKFHLKFTSIEKIINKIYLILSFRFVIVTIRNEKFQIKIEWFHGVNSIKKLIKFIQID